MKEMNMSRFIEDEEPPETYIRQVFDKIDPSMKQVGGTHYKTMPIQPGTFIRKNNIGWYEGNAIKYICRHKQKGGVEDLRKAIHYLELAMSEYKGDGNEQDLI